MDQLKSYFGKIPQDVNQLILYQTVPENLLAACNGDPYLSHICHLPEFRENYTAHWKDYILDKYKDTPQKSLELASIIGSFPLISEILNIRNFRNPDLSNILLGFFKGQHFDLLDDLFLEYPSLWDMRNYIAEISDINRMQINFDVKSPAYRELLQTAIRLNNSIIVISLLDHIASMDYMLREGEMARLLKSALFTAILRNNPGMLKLILESSPMNKIYNNEKDPLLRFMYDVASSNKKSGLDLSPEIFQLLGDYIEGMARYQKYGY